jgi:signal transduction histidine kinase
LSQTSIDLLNLFVRSPGELLYFFIIIAVSLASLFMAVGQRHRRPDDLAAQRYSWALSGVVISWIVLMIGAVLTVVTEREPVSILPPLERFASVMTILFITWGFLTAGHHGSSFRSTLLLSIAALVTIGGYGFTAAEWIDLAGTVDFNLNEYGVTWTFAAAALTVAGILLVLVNFRSVVDAPLKLVYFGILLAGYGGTLLQIAQGNIIGDYAGPVRLAFAAALVIVPGIVYRSIVAWFETHAAQAAEAASKLPPPPPPMPRPDPPPAISPIERESVQLLRALGLILEDATPATMSERIVKAIIDILKADVAALLRLQDANYADVDFAYNNVMKRSIDGISINLDNQPTLANCIERGEQRALFPDRNAEELQDFYTRLDVEQTGPLYLQPLKRDNELIAVLVVALPYSDRELFVAEQELLKGIAVISSNLLALSFAANDARLLAEEKAIQALVRGVPAEEVEDETLSARSELQASLQVAREQISQLSKQVLELKVELDEERSRIAADLDDTDEGLSVSQQVLALTEEHQKLREERDSLLKRLQEAEAALHGAVSTGDSSVLNDMTEALMLEKEDLIAQREKLQQQLDDLRANDRIILPQDMQVLVNNMTEEKSRLEDERDRFSAKLEEIHSQLSALGVEEGPAGAAQLINQLSEQRAMLQTQNAVLKKERDKLFEERSELIERMQQEEEREKRLQTLQNELKNLAGDREAALKQREKARAEREEMQARLDVVREQLTELQVRLAEYEQELGESHQIQTELRQQIQELADGQSNVQNEHDRLLAEKRAIENERDQLLARVEGDRERLQELGANGVGSLTAMIEELTTQRNQLEHELHQTRTALASLENELEAVRMRVGKELKPSRRQHADNPDLLLGLVQELRTPMTSIAGYIDLLLGESAGILGEMQRKFLQRVSTNVMRLASMLDDLIHVTELDTGRFTLEPGTLNLMTLIEEAITNASIQFREKGLAVNLNLSDEVSEVTGDRDAISQIIGQLLTNAYLASPPSAELTVTADRQQVILTRSDNDDEYMADCFIVSVQDRGGGINPEDEARVFIRKYKAENPLIQGLGDTGVGLSIAKALAEAHGGRLWLESEAGVGSTFYLALPVVSTNQPEELDSDAT